MQSFSTAAGDVAVPADWYGTGARRRHRHLPAATGQWFGWAARPEVTHYVRRDRRCAPTRRLRRQRPSPTRPSTGVNRPVVRADRTPSDQYGAAGDVPLAWPGLCAEPGSPTRERGIYIATVRVALVLAADRCRLRNRRRRTGARGAAGDDNFASAQGSPERPAPSAAPPSTQREAGEPTHRSAGTSGSANSIWYSWTAPASGPCVSTLQLESRHRSLPRTPARVLAP